jgi:hypothetical protein
VRTLLRWLAKYPAIRKGLDGLEYKPTNDEMALRTKKRLRTLKSGKS